MIALVRSRRRLVPGMIAAGWTLSVFAELTGHGRPLHHDKLIEGGLPLWAALGIFVLAWQAMIAAMMLPSSLPLIALFERTVAGAPNAGRARATFLSGYGAVWTGFGIVAFIGDIGLHRTVHKVPWLAAHPWMIAGGTLMLAGLFQFSSLKEKCLSECRNPGAYMLKHYRRGNAEAFKLGAGHGLFCLGCCWALMLVAFAAGVANLWWMAAFTAIMVFEKTGRGGDRGALPIGVALITLGTLVMAHPSWLPTAFG